MCGIGYEVAFNGSPVNDSILARYKDQRLRGTEGFGIYDRSEDNIVKTPKEEKFLGWLKRYNSNDILFHHRTPTSAPNVKNACHPFSTGDRFDKTYIMVHNGWINNCNTLVKEHEDEFDIDYTSIQENLEFNDSESLVWDFALWREGLISQMKAVGYITFICIVKEESGDKLYFYRNTNPLKAIISLEGITLSSEGEGQNVPKDTLFCYDYTTGLLTFEDLELETVQHFYNYTPGNYNDADKDDDPIEAAKISEQLALINARSREEDEVNAESWIDKYTYPITRAVVEGLWPKDKEKNNTYNLNYSKAVTRYLNNKLKDCKGVYEEVYDMMEEDCRVYEKTLNTTATKGKSKLKYQHRLKTAIIAIDILFSLPSWQNDNRPVDPAFIEEPVIERQAA